jgi:hypothetical protein
MHVLLYRPGFETVDIPARAWWQSLGWSQPQPVAWKEAPDLPAQEEALNNVVQPRFDPPRKGSKAVLQFAAQEYARLADSPFALALSMSDTRERLLAKAREYEKLSNQDKQ